MTLEELEHPAPGVLRGFRVILLLAVEEAVRRPLVGDELVLDAGVLERSLEGGVLIGGDVLVGAGLEREDRRLDLGCALDRPGTAAALAGHAVEADRAREPVPARGGEPG